MSLIAYIKAESLEARRARNSVKATSLITLLSEATMIGKNDGNRETTDAETISVIKKFIKNIDETLSHRLKHGFDSVSVELKNELELLSSFLPQQLNEDQIEYEMNVLLGFPHKFTKMGDLLKEFKNKFDGRYNGSIASSIAKTLLS